MKDRNSNSFRSGRRTFVRAGLGAAGGLVLPGWALAQGKAPLGTWPAGSQGKLVNIGVAVPRTGT